MARLSGAASKGRVFFSLCAVYIVGGIPIAAHLVAVQVNEGSLTVQADFQTALIADTYLYTFIIALAGVIDSLNSLQKNLSLLFLILAGAAGFMYYNANLQVVVNHSAFGTWLSSLVWLLLLVTFVGYGLTKTLILYGIAKADREDEDQHVHQRGGING